MVMVTHDAHAAEIADRVLFLADGRDRRGAASQPGRGDPRGHGPRERMIKVALAGLLGRKLRTALTAIAIVLGVAMVSGTFVLTDSIDKAFNSIFTDVRKGSDVVVTRQVGVRPLAGPGLVRADAAASRCSPRCAALPGRRCGRGQRRRRGAARRPERQGDRLRRRAEPRLQHRRTPQSPFNPLRARRRHVAARQRGRDRQEHRRPRSTSQVGDTIGVQAEGPVQQLKISGLVKFGSAASLGGATLAGFDLPTAQRLFDKQGQLDEIAVAAEAERLRRRAPADASQAILPPTAQVRTGDGAGARGREPTRTRFITLPARLPARLRRHRALRRQLRDRQLALDHDRAADARARDAAHARREPRGRC